MHEDFGAGFYPVEGWHPSALIQFTVPPPPFGPISVISGNGCMRLSSLIVTGVTFMYVTAGAQAAVGQAQGVL
jgi:hypothetical protein